MQIRIGIIMMGDDKEGVEMTNMADEDESDED